MKVLTFFCCEPRVLTPFRGQKKTFFRREVERTTLVPIPNGLSNLNQRLNNNNNNIYLNTIKITVELMWSCILKLKQSLQVNKKL